ncbi:MAG: CinA family protein [Hyphomicrobium sp.]
MFSADELGAASGLVGDLRRKGLTLVAAESCTGGMITTLLTEIAGASDVLDRGFVTYSNAAKIETLAVAQALIDRHGAVSAVVAVAMAEGALARSHADIAVAVTGIAGPGGGSPQKPVGLVYIAVGRRGGAPEAQRFSFGDIGRSAIRLAAVREALRLAQDAVVAY